MFGDGGVDNDKILGGDRSTMAAIPLRLGVVPLNIGSVRFQENGWFEAKDWNSGTMVKGKLIANTGQNISGVEYETEKYPEAKYVVVFLSDFHQQTNAMDYPIRKWISFALIETNTYLLDMVSIASIEVTHEKLQDKYFHPSFWLTQTSSIPIVSAFIVNHQLMVKNGDKLIPTPKASEDEPRAGLKLRIIQAILLIFATVPLVIWCLKRKQNGKSALDENNKINI
jgi:hypothetical protein